jgi:transketolase
MTDQTAGAIQGPGHGCPGGCRWAWPTWPPCCSKHLKFDASEPRWPDRDRFILSAGHGSMLLYSLLHLTGYADMTLDEIKKPSASSAPDTAGHPEYGHARGHRDDHRPAGPGHRQFAVGFAMAERHLPPASAATSSTTTPTSSPATAA